MAFNAHCASWQYHPDVQAEMDDIAMLRLLAKDSGALSVLPPVVIKDEIEQGILEAYQHIPDIYENFYAITTRRKFVPNIFLEFIRQNIEDEWEIKNIFWKNIDEQEANVIFYIWVSCIRQKIDA